MTNLDTAHKLLNHTVSKLELTLGEETNRETTHEGRVNFKMTCMFCDNENRVTTRKFEVFTGNGFVKEIRG